MIKKLPVIYPKESVYSWLARSYSQSGVIYYKYFVEELFENKGEVLDYNFINLFNKEFKRLIKRTIGFESLLVNHTLFKYYSRFIDCGDRKEVYFTGINNKELLSKKLHIPPNRKNYFLRYCPLCVQEDRREFGECYFHIEHQIYDIHICPKHGVELIDTLIKNDKSSDKTFFTLEQLDPDVEGKRYEKEDINVRVSRYIGEVFEGDIKINNDVLVSDYLSSKLTRSQCVDEACTKKNIIGLTKDLSSFYKGLKVFNLSSYVVCDVLRGVRRNPYDVLLISYYLGIKPRDLCVMKLSKEEIRRPIMRKVFELYKSGFDMETISLKVGRKKTQVQRIINGYLKIKKTKKESQQSLN